MSFSLIDKNAEDILYATIVAEENGAGHNNGEDAQQSNYIHCRFFQINKKIDTSDFEKYLPQIEDFDYVVYVCSDGDVFIKIPQEPAELVSSIIKKITQEYGKEIKKFMPIEDFFVLYGWNRLEAGSQIKLECSKKMKKQTAKGVELKKYFSDIRLISTLKKVNQLTRMQRAFRTSPHILIVEDQIFSQKILTSILKDFTCYVAASSGEALVHYIEKCPDIVFLDIDLPDISGHNFARFVNKIDSECYIVIISANQYTSDLKEAKENNVKGYIAKPYQKDSILKIMDQFMKSKKRK